MRAGLHAFIRRLKALEIQGARQIAIQSLLFLKNYDTSFGSDFERAAKQLEAARPTAVVLHNCLEILRRERSVDAIDRLIERLSAATPTISEHGARLIKRGNVIMTHCHSGEALSVIKAISRKRCVSVIATITEPAHQGIRTAKELRDAGIEVTLIADPAVGFFMPHVDVVLTGSDALRHEGNVNKIGTYVLALAAATHKKPFYVAADTLKLDRRPKLVIEERPAGEILNPVKGVAIRNPAFDVTPWKYIRYIITESGIKTPEQIRRML